MIAKLAAWSAVLAVAVSPIPPPLEAGRPVPEANIRFINRLDQDATVSANGTVVFARVTPGSVTGWSTVRDTVTTFTLAVGSPDTIRATTSASLMNGSHYTVSAMRGPEGGMVLAVLRDNGPEDTVNIARPRPGGGAVKP